MVSFPQCQSQTSPPPSSSPVNIPSTPSYKVTKGTTESSPTSQTDFKGASPVSYSGICPSSLSLKRRYCAALPSDNDPGPEALNPLTRKKAKTLLTSISLKRKAEIEDLHAMRLLQLARATRATFAARQKYHRLRLKELEILRLMATDECEESEALLKDGVQQLGEVKHAVNSEGLGFYSRTSGLFPEISSYSDLESADDNDSDHGGRGPSVHNISSPTSSVGSQASDIA